MENEQSERIALQIFYLIKEGRVDSINIISDIITGLCVALGSIKCSGDKDFEMLMEECLSEETISKIKYHSRMFRNENVKKSN